MFKLVPASEFWAPVQLSIPGKTIPVEVQFKFKHQNREDFQAFGASLAEITIFDALKQIVVDWKGVDAKFDDAALETLLNNYIQSGSQILSAYFNANAGAASKN